MESPSNSLNLNRLLFASPSFPTAGVLEAILDRFGAILKFYIVVGEGELLLDIQLPSAWAS